MVASEKPTLDYHAGDDTGSFAGLRSAAFIGALVDMMLIGVAYVARRMQLRQPDSYHTPWAVVAAYAWLVFLLVWLLLLLGTIVLSARGGRASAVCYIWLGVGGLLILGSIWALSSA